MIYISFNSLHFEATNAILIILLADRARNIINPLEKLYGNRSMNVADMRHKMVAF